LAAAAATVGVPLGVPSVMVRLEPLMESVDGVPVGPKVIAAVT